jgi:four helix bundle protein
LSDAEIPNAEFRMTKERSYDLEERTAKFGEAVIELCLRIEETSVRRPVLSQFVRAATSVGANYCEADDAESPKDFRHKIALCRKESRETKFWCRMLAKTIPAEKAAIRALWKEAHELNLIFSTIFRKTKLT